MIDDEEKLKSLIKKLKIILHETQIYCQKMINDSENQELISNTLLSCNSCQEYLDYVEINFNNMRQFLNGRYYKVLNLIKELFVKIIIFTDTNFFSIEKWSEKNTLTLFFANYIILNQNYRVLKEIINSHFIESYKATYQLVVDEYSPLWDISETQYLEFASDITQIRDMARLVVNNVKYINENFPLTILEEQTSEIIKNAVKHGNKNNKDKIVKVWYLINDKMFKIIVEDEGEGFTNMDDWNEYNKKRNEALKKGDMEEMLKYIQYKGPNTQDDDGGNSLFAALEYWDSGLVYSNKKNKVVAVKYLYS